LQRELTGTKTEQKLKLFRKYQGFIINSWLAIPGNSQFWTGLMKPRNQYEENKHWVRSALRLYNNIIRARFEVELSFPNQEFLHQFSTLDTQKKSDMRKFLNFDTTRLVKLSEVEKLLFGSDSAGENTGEIVYFELKDIYAKSLQVKNMVVQYASCVHKTYPEAKSLFAKILQLGIWVEEAEAVARVIRQNKQIDLQEEDSEFGFPRIRELTEPDKYLDGGFRKDFGLKLQEGEDLQRRIDALLSKLFLDTGDIATLKSLSSKAHEGNFSVTGLDKLDNVYKSYCWVEKLAKSFYINTKATSLSSLIAQLSFKVAGIVHSSEFQTYEDILKESREIPSSMSPISQILQEVKLIFWNKEADTLLSSDKLSIPMLEVLISRASPFFSSENVKLAQINKLLEEANEWNKRANRLQEEVRKVADERLEPHKATLNHIIHLESMLTALIKHLTPDLEKFEELVPFKLKLIKWELVFRVFKLILKIRNGDKTELRDYIDLKDALKQTECQEFANTSLFENFKQLSIQFSQDYEALKAFSQKLEKEQTKNPELFEPAFLNYLRDLKKLDTICNHIAKLEKHFFLGEFGFGIKDYIAKYRRAESSLLAIAEAKPLSWLEKSEPQEIEATIKEFQLRKKDLVIRFYSPTIEDLARYEWILKATELLKQSKPRLDALEKLENSSVGIKFNDRELIEKIVKRRELGYALKAPIEQLLSSPSHAVDLDKLRSMKEDLDSHPISIPSLARKINSELLDAEFVIEEVNEIERTMRDHPGQRLVNLGDLMILLKDIKSLCCKLPDIEAKVKNYICSSEKSQNKLLELIDCFPSKHPYEKEQIDSAIKAYLEGGIAIREIENILSKRKDALERLEGIKVEDLAGKTFRELSDIENWVRDSLDSRKAQDLWDCVLKRKLKQLLYLSAQSTKLSSIEHPAEGLLRREEFDVFLSRIRTVKGISEDEIAILSSKRDKLDQYLNQIKKYSIENLKKCSRTLFNFLDVSPIIRKALEEKTNEALRPETQQDTMDVTIEGKRIMKEHMKEHRKNYIKKLVDSLSCAFGCSSKAEVRDLVISLDDATYSKTKPNLGQYVEHMDHYLTFIDRFKENKVLCELVIEKNLGPNVIKYILEDQSGSPLYSCDEKTVRSYLKSVQLALNSFHEETEALGKRVPIKAKIEDESPTAGVQDYAPSLFPKPVLGGPVKKLKEASFPSHSESTGQFSSKRNTESTYNGSTHRNSEHADYISERNIQHLNILNEDNFNESSNRYQKVYQKDTKKYSLKKTSKRLNELEDKSETKDGRLADNTDPDCEGSMNVQAMMTEHISEAQPLLPHSPSPLAAPPLCSPGILDLEQDRCSYHLPSPSPLSRLFVEAHNEERRESYFETVNKSSKRNPPKKAHGKKGGKQKGGASQKGKGEGKPPLDEEIVENEIKDILTNKDEDPSNAIKTAERSEEVKQPSQEDKSSKVNLYAEPDLTNRKVGKYNNIPLIQQYALHNLSLVGNPADEALDPKSLPDPSDEELEGEIIVPRPVTPPMCQNSSQVMKDELCQNQNEACSPLQTTDANTLQQMDVEDTKQAIEPEALDLDEERQPKFNINNEIAEHQEKSEGDEIKKLTDGGDENKDEPEVPKEDEETESNDVEELLLKESKKSKTKEDPESKLRQIKLRPRDKTSSAKKKVLELRKRPYTKKKTTEDKKEQLVIVQPVQTGRTRRAQIREAKVMVQLRENSTSNDRAVKVADNLPTITTRSKKIISQDEIVTKEEKEEESITPHKRNTRRHNQINQTPIKKQNTVDNQLQSSIKQSKRRRQAKVAMIKKTNNQLSSANPAQLSEKSEASEADAQEEETTPIVKDIQVPVNTLPEVQPTSLQIKSKSNSQKETITKELPKPAAEPQPMPTFTNLERRGKDEANSQGTPSKSRSNNQNHKSLSTHSGINDKDKKKQPNGLTSQSKLKLKRTALQRHNRRSESSFENITDLGRDETTSNLGFEEFKEMKLKIKKENSRNGKVSHVAQTLINSSENGHGVDQAVRTTHTLEAKGALSAVKTKPESMVEETFNGSNGHRFKQLGTNSASKVDIESFRLDRLNFDDNPVRKGGMGYWIIYDNEITFPTLGKTVSDVKLISLSKIVKINQLNDFNSERLTIQSVLTLEEFGQEIGSDSSKIAKNEVFIVTGFLHSDSEGANFREAAEQLKGQVFRCEIMEGMRLYLMYSQDLTGGVKFMFEKIEDYEGKGSNLVWLIVQESKKVGPRGRIINPNYFEAKPSKRSIMRELVLDENAKKEPDMEAVPITWGNNGGQIKFAEGTVRTVERVQELKEITTDLLNFGTETRKASGNFEIENGDFDAYIQKNLEKGYHRKHRRDTIEECNNRDRSRSGDMGDKDANLSISSIVSGFCK
jgi:hypothetical protein